MSSMDIGKTPVNRGAMNDIRIANLPLRVFGEGIRALLLYDNQGQFKPIYDVIASLNGHMRGRIEPDRPARSAPYRDGVSTIAPPPDPLILRVRWSSAFTVAVVSTTLFGSAPSDH